MLNQTATLAGITAAHKESERIEKKLIDTITDENAELFDRVDACRQLGTIGSKASIEPLASLLHNDKLSHMARYGLETNPDASVNEVLRKALDGAEGRNLMGIIHSLGERGDTKAVDAIAKHISNSDKHVSVIAGMALGRIGTEEAFNAIRAAIRSGTGNKLGLYDGALSCAASFAASGKKEMAQRIYTHLQEMDTPHQVKTGAKLAAERLG